MSDKEQKDPGGREREGVQERALHVHAGSAWTHKGTWGRVLLGDHGCPLPRGFQESASQPPGLQGIGQALTMCN